MQLHGQVLVDYGTDAYFKEGIKVSTTDYGLTKGKYIKACYVHLWDGNYDSGRVYSGTAKKATISIMRANYHVSIILLRHHMLLMDGFIFNLK